MAWFKQQCFEKGIPPQVFKKIQVRDLLEIFEINNALNRKQLRQDEIDRMIQEMRW